MSKNRFIRILIVLAAMLVLFSSPVYASTKLQLNKKTAKMYVGDTLQLTLNGAGAKKVIWSSSNKKIATVTQKGLVKAKKVGKATITAKICTKKFKCKITIIKAKDDKTTTTSKTSTTKSNSTTTKSKSTTTKSKQKITNSQSQNQSQNQTTTIQFPPLSLESIKEALPNGTFTINGSNDTITAILLAPHNNTLTVNVEVPHNVDVQVPLNITRTGTN